MLLERCGRCTAPIYVRLAASWNQDGTVTGRFASKTRVVQVYADEIDYILSGISERIGLDISRIVTEGERKAGLDFTGAIFAKLGGLVGVLSRSFLFRRIVFVFVLKAAKNAGFGDCHLVEYRHRRRMVVRFRDPFNPPILSGNMLGAFEAFSRRPGVVDWEVAGDVATITITSDGPADRIGDERLKPVLPPTLPGDYHVERCPRCRMPVEIGRRYHFDLKKGIATEVETGRRIVTVMVESLTAIFGELAAELGDEVGRMVVELESEYMEGIAPRGEQATEEVLRGLLGDLCIKGMGNPVSVSVGDAEIEVRVENPFSEELLAGRVLGFHRALFGGPADVEWTPDRAGFMTIRTHR
ncbi:MAG: hypothetical protein V1748_01305 [Actinomycetota bacterium]